MRQAPREFRSDENTSFVELNALPSAVNPREGLPFFLPHLGGRVSPAAPPLRGAWARLAWDHTRAELYRATREAVALEYAIYQRAVRRLLPGAAFTELRITRGGENSAVWNQIKADVLQMPIVQIRDGGGASMGAAMLAGTGAGLFPSLPEASARSVTLGQRFEPDSSRASYYRGRIARYEALLKVLGQWAAQVLSPNLFS